MISSGSPHVRPMGRTCGEPDEIELTAMGVKLNGSRCRYFDDTLAGVKCFSERPFHNRLGDGREVTTAELAALGDAFRHAATRFEWQAGDVLCLDNFSFGHGRDPYTGNREVLASMGNTVHWGAGSANT